MKYIISVSKTFSHRGDHKHRPKTKKIWQIYYYEDGNFKTERVDFIQALFYMTRKWKKIKLYCNNCQNLFYGLVKSKKDVVACPYCVEQ